MSVYEPRRHLALALDRECAALLEQERLTQELSCAVRYLDPSRNAMGFHAAGDGHGVTPHVVDVQAFADHSGHHRAARDPDTYLQRMPAALVESVQCIDHVQRQVRCPRRMVARG